MSRQPALTPGAEAGDQRQRETHTLYRGYALDTLAHAPRYLKKQPARRDLANSEWLAWWRETVKTVRTDEAAALTLTLGGAPKQPYTRRAELFAAADDAATAVCAENFARAQQAVTGETEREALLLATALPRPDAQRLTLRTGYYRPQFYFGLLPLTSREVFKFSDANGEPLSDEERGGLLRAVAALEERFNTDEELKKILANGELTPAFWTKFLPLSVSAEDEEERGRLRELTLALDGEGVSLYDEPLPVQIALARWALRPAYRANPEVRVPLAPGIIKALKDKQYLAVTNSLVSSEDDGPSLPPVSGSGERPVTGGIFNASGPDANGAGGEPCVPGAGAFFQRQEMRRVPPAAPAR